MLSLMRNPYLFTAIGAFVLLSVFVSPVLASLQPICPDGNCLPLAHIKVQAPPNAIKSQLKYGPFTVPGMDVNGGMERFVMKMAIPCSDCLITHVRAELEYPDGSYANADTGMWLHHAVIYNMNRTDTTCPKLPDRIFAFGNERTPLDLTLQGTVKAGYYVGANDSLGLLLELMNEVMEARDAVLTIDWEYLPGRPRDHKLVTLVWLDIDGVCSIHGSELHPPNDMTIFSFEMQEPWMTTTSAAGEIIVGFGHLHDGGVDIQIIKNGETIFDSIARYGESAGYVQVTEMEMDGKKMAMEMTHISSMSELSNIKTEAGDRWTVKANYDFGKHQAMMEGSTQHL